MKRLEFEKAFLFAARDFLRCRLLVMGGKAEGDCGGGLEGALLGMLDWKGELGIMCQESLGSNLGSSRRITHAIRQECRELHP